jgi:catechol 2,3-dioxygenase-like lactoylglutathione lyase family enzyme
VLYFGPCSKFSLGLAVSGDQQAKCEHTFPRIGIGLDSVEIGVNGRLDTGRGIIMQTTTRYGTRDLARAKTFYDAIAEILGGSRVLDRENVAGYKGPEGGMFMIGTPNAGEATAGNGTQVVFPAPNRAAVDAAHAKALELGGKCEGPPGLRGPEEMGYYAAYARDLDGNKIMFSRVGPE